MSRLGTWFNRKHPVKRSRRRAFGITAYTGANGGGKSAAMVADAIPDLVAGRPVLSTVRILDWENPRECDDERCMENPDRLDHFRMRPTLAGREAEKRNGRRLFFDGPGAVLEPVEMESRGVHPAAHEGWIPWERHDQLLLFNFGRVLADEMTGVFSSRESQSLPSEVLNHLQQLRRVDTPFAYTCPDWARTDKSLREPTQSVTVCTGYWSTTLQIEGEEDRQWKPRRMFKWSTFDARTLDELTEGRRQDLDTEVTEWHWGPDSLAFKAYDTFAPVLQVGTLTESGNCFRCGGSRPRPKCGCHSSPAVDQAADGGAPSGAAKRAARGAGSRRALAAAVDPEPVTRALPTLGALADA